MKKKFKNKIKRTLEEADERRSLERELYELFEITSMMEYELKSCLRKS
ncbi:MAG: hypothetical protein QXX55_01700 [Candidatus Pacearchaeota archaeon]